MRLSYSVNQYDNEGDIYDKCILIHCDNNHIIKFDDLKELDRFINKLLILKDQIIKEVI